MPRNGKQNGANSTGNKIFRRKFLIGVGAAGATGLAGCGGDSSSTTTENQPDDSGSGGQDSGNGGQTGNTDDGEWGDYSGETVHVLLEAPGQSMMNMYERIAGGFEDATGATVNMEYTATGSLGDRLAQLISAGDPPEVLHPTQLSGIKYYNDDILQPLTETYNEMAELWGEPAENNRMNYDGEDYLVPLYLERGIEWYREDVWDSKPSTWEEELTQAEQNHNTNGLSGFYVGVGSDVCNHSQVAQRVYENEGRFYKRDSNGEIQIAIDDENNRQKFIEAFDHLAALHEYSPTAADATCGTLSTAISSEVSSGQWYVGFRPKGNSVSADRSFAGSVKPYYARSDNPTHVFGQASGWVQPRGANSAEAAREWMKFAFQPEFFTDFLMATPVHNVPAYPGVRNGDSYQGAVQEWADESPGLSMETVNEFFDLTVERGMSPPIEVEGGNPYAGTLMFGTNRVMQPLQQIILEGEDTATAVDNFADTAREALADAKE
jgi:ABC-type glycerol-3-phosphate transport system substrate-binding protein